MNEAIGPKRGILAGARTRELFNSTGLRALFALGLVAALVVAAGPADAAVPKRAKISKKDKETRKASAPIPKGPLHIVVSIGQQRISLYANGAPVASSGVSTGRRGFPTPTGVFSIIQKNRHHRSNIYSGAPMPFMQRITWSGVALHAGALPGYPASHGCIRLTPAFASYLWTATRMNARVIVTHGNVAPVDVAHPRLFVYKKPDPPAVLEQSSEGSKPEVRTAESGEPGKTSDAPKMVEAVSAAGRARTSVANKAPEPPKVVSAEAPERNKTAESSKLADNGAAFNAINTTTNAAKEGSKATPVATAFVAAAPAPAPALAVQLKPTVAAVVQVPSTKVVVLAEPAPAPKAAEPVQPDETTKAKPPKADPVSVFISRKTSKLYVRHGWDPLFEMPVTIRNPELAWGTHVFTAMEFKQDQSTLRWVALSLAPDAPRNIESRSEKRTGKKSGQTEPTAASRARPQQTATQVLDLLDIPQEAIDRISELMKPGSSLIVSDNPMSNETGKGTDFIVQTRS